MNVDLDIKNLYLGKRNLGHVKFKSILENRQISTLSGNIYLNREKYVFFEKLNEGSNKINMDFNDLGIFLNEINLTDNVMGGKGYLEFTLDSNDQQFISGTFNIKKYNIKKASYLARLLQLASFTGLLDILASEGIPFNLLKGSFIIDKGKLFIKDARLEGVSLGASIEGELDLNNKNISLQGVLIPAYAINSIINKIPLVGQVVTGTKGEGLIGVNYKVEGTFEKPDYSINPLSILTPGILRNIFDIFKIKEIEEEASQ